MPAMSQFQNINVQKNVDIQTSQGQKCTKKYAFRDRKKIQRNLQTLNFDQCLRKPDKRRLGGWFLKEKQKYLNFLQQNFYTQFMDISQFYSKMAQIVRTRNIQEVKAFHQKNMLKYSGIQNLIKCFSQIVEEKKLEKIKFAQKQKKNNLLIENKCQTNQCNDIIAKEVQVETFPKANLYQPNNIIYYPTNDIPKIQHRPFFNKYSIWMENNLIMEQMIAAKKFRQTLAIYQQIAQHSYSQINFKEWSPVSNFVAINSMQANVQLTKKQEDV